jgi:hypothetical protein
MLCHLRQSQREFHLNFICIFILSHVSKFDELADVRTQVWNRVEHRSRHSISSHEVLDFKGIVVLHSKFAASQVQSVLTSSLHPPPPSSVIPYIR